MSCRAFDKPYSRYVLLKVSNTQMMTMMLDIMKLNSNAYCFFVFGQLNGCCIFRTTLKRIQFNSEIRLEHILIFCFRAGGFSCRNPYSVHHHCFCNGFQLLLLNGHQNNINKIMFFDGFNCIFAADHFQPPQTDELLLKLTLKTFANGKLNRKTE